MYSHIKDERKIKALQPLTWQEAMVKVSRAGEMDKTARKQGETVSIFQELIMLAQENGLKRIRFLYFRTHPLREDFFPVNTELTGIGALPMCFLHGRARNTYAPTI